MRPRPRLARVPLFARRTAGPRGGPACENPGRKAVHASGDAPAEHHFGPNPRAGASRPTSARRLPLFAPRAPQPHVVTVSHPILTMPYAAAQRQWSTWNGIPVGSSHDLSKSHNDSFDGY